MGWTTYDDLKDKTWNDVSKQTWNSIKNLTTQQFIYTVLYLHPDCGVSQSAVSDLRKGKIIGIKTLDAMCGLLRCQPGDLIAWKEPGE